MPREGRGGAAECAAQPSQSPARSRDSGHGSVPPGLPARVVVSSARLRSPSDRHLGLARPGRKAGTVRADAFTNGERPSNTRQASRHSFHGRSTLREPARLSGEPPVVFCATARDGPAAPFGAGDRSPYRAQARAALNIPRRRRAEGPGASRGHLSARAPWAGAGALAEPCARPPPQRPAPRHGMPNSPRAGRSRRPSAGAPL